MSKKLPFQIPGDYDEGLTIHVLEVPDGEYSEAALVHEFDKAHDAGFTGKGVKIGIIDTGIKSHLDLYSPEFTDHSEVFKNAIDKAGHGTQVMGIAGMRKDNKIGYVGAAYGATFYIYKALGLQGGSAQSVAVGIRTLVDAGVDIINMSLGTPKKINVIEGAIEYAQSKGVIIWASAGNETSGDLSYPASNDYVLASKAVDVNLKHAKFSNLSKVNRKDNCFAGVGVDVPTTNIFGAYSTPSGTSFSIVFNACTCAIFYEMCMTYYGRFPTRDELLILLKHTALDIDEEGRDDKTGFGLTRPIPMPKSEMDLLLQLPESNVCAVLKDEEMDWLDKLNNPKRFIHRWAKSLLS